MVTSWPVRNRSKLRNIKTTVDGHKFDSKREANRYCELKLMQRAGEISDLELQPQFVLQEAFRDAQGKHRRAIKYRADFRYTKGDKTIVEDVKGHKTPLYLVKKKLLLKRLVSHKNTEFHET